MPLRISTQSVYSRVLMGLRFNQFASIRAQEQIATGRRLLRPSDDPTGTARSLSISRQIAEVGRRTDAVRDGKALVDTATSALEDGSRLFSDARERLLQALNGTLSESDRSSIASEFELLRSQMIDLANLRSGDRYLFGGTENSGPPWQTVVAGGLTRTVYVGNDEDQLLRVGDGVDVGIGLPGPEIFGRHDASGTRYEGLTGAARGTTADQGSGYEYLRLRHDATDAGTLASVGIQLVDGGDRDTLLGDQSLVIDVAAGTIRLGNGPVRDLPPIPGDAAPDFQLRTEHGGELHLDLSGFTGVDYSGTVRGEGSASLDGTTYTTLDFTEADLELSNPGTGSILHVDTRGIDRAGTELVTFGGTVNAFDLLQGISEDLVNGSDLNAPEVQARLGQRLDDLNRLEDDLLVGLGVLGSRSQRLTSAEDRAQGVELSLQDLLSDVRDVDISEAALELSRSEFALQAAQASGARLLQHSLLNFLG